MTVEVRLSHYLIVHFHQTEMHGVPLGSSSTESLLLPYHWNINVPVQT
jgi:hypothetical protein